MSARAAIAAACAVLFLAPQFAAAQTDPVPPGEILLELEVGETRLLGAGKLPPLNCDDPSVALALIREGSLALRGIKPGTTLCSALTATSLWQRYRVRVTGPRPSP